MTVSFVIRYQRSILLRKLGSDAWFLVFQADLDQRIAALEKGAQYDANQAVIRQREQEMLTTLREIRESMANAGANAVSSTEVEGLKDENAKLKATIVKQEYRIRHLIKGYEELLAEKKVEEVVEEA